MPSPTGVLTPFARQFGLLKTRLKVAAVIADWLSKKVN